MIGPAGLAPLAVRQLAAWQAVALDWPLHLNEARFGLLCPDCDGQVVALIDVRDHSYRATPQLILDATVMHLRARHADMEPAGL